MPAKKNPAPAWEDYPEPESFPSEEARIAYRKAKNSIKLAWQKWADMGIQPNLGNALVGLGLTVLPPEIGLLTALTELYLQNNRLTALPPEIGKLTALTILSLSNNQLTALPPEIGQLTGLGMLALSDNHLTSLPREIGQLKALLLLDLSLNFLTTLPPEIGQLKWLTRLDLFYNRLTALPAEIGQLTQLQTLSLSDNQLTALPPEMGSLRQLHDLYLHGNSSLNLPPEVLGKKYLDTGLGQDGGTEPVRILEYYFKKRGSEVVEGTSVSNPPPEQQPLASGSLDPTEPPPPLSVASPQLQPPAGYEQTALRMSADQVGAVDGLQRGSLVEVLCDIYCAKKAEMPQTVTVEAPWGDGKSTLMALLIKRLKENHKETTAETVRARVVEFNPWRYQTAEGLWSGFLAEFTAQIQEGKSFWEKVMMHWRYGKEMHGMWKMLLLWLPLLFSSAVYLMRNSLWNAMKAEGVWAGFFLNMLAVAPLLLVALKLALVFWRPVRTFTTEMKTYFKKPDYAAGRDASERLHVEFCAWVRAAVKTDERVFVFIDDLDRCPGPRAAELLEWLQLLLSGKGNREEGGKLPLLLVAGLDREKVAAAVAIKHQEVMRLLSQGKAPKEQAEEAISWGYEYLEKFIDLPVRVPPGSEEVLEGYLELLAPGAFEAEKSELDKVGMQWRERLMNMPQPIREGQKVNSNTATLPEPTASALPGTPMKDLEDPRIPDFLRAAAILLRHSPRRMKHFLNLLRLRWALRQKLGRDRMTLEMTARLVLLEVARPTLFRALADNRKLRELVFHQSNEDDDDEFRPNGPWKNDAVEGLFAADRRWLEDYGMDLLVRDWEDLRMSARDKFNTGQPLEVERTPPMNLRAFNALLDGTRYRG